MKDISIGKDFLIKPRTQIIKRERQMGSNHTRELLHSKCHDTESEEVISASDVCKIFISRIYNEFKNLSHEKHKQPSNEMNMSRRFSKDEIQMVKIHTRTFSSSLEIMGTSSLW